MQHFKMGIKFSMRLSFVIFYAPGLSNTHDPFVASHSCAITILLNDFAPKESL